MWKTSLILKKIGACKSAWSLGFLAYIVRSDIKDESTETNYLVHAIFCINVAVLIIPNVASVFTKQPLRYLKPAA